MGNWPQDEITNRTIRERSLVDDQLDRWRVEGLQELKLSHTNDRRLNQSYEYTEAAKNTHSIRSLRDYPKRGEAQPGDCSGGDTPGSIPNPAVKSASADGT